MAVVLAWLRLDLRRRWRSLAVLALLIAVAGGTVMTALAGARRGASSLHRTEATTLPATSAILANTPGFDWNAFRTLPEVESLTTFVVDYAYHVEGVGDPGAFPPADDATMRTIEKPVVFKGRVFDPTRADEVVVTRRFVSNYHKTVGDTLIIDLPTPKELVGAGPQPGRGYTGPHITVRIVGVVLSPWFSDPPGGTGGMVMSPGIVAKYSANIIGDPHDPGNLQFVNALVRLKGGEAALPQLRSDVERITKRSDIDVWNLPAQFSRPVQKEITFEARCLAAFALAAFVAALFLVGQAIARYAAASTAELQTFRALGMTPRQAIGTAAAGPIIAGVIGAVLGVIGTVVASRWFPIGTAKVIERAPGTSVDWVVIGLGLAAVILLVAGGAAAAAWLGLGAARRIATARRSTVAAAVARGGFAVPVVVGTRFALEAGRGRTSVPVRPALIGAVTGVLGILAAFTFSHGVSDAASHPERFGQTFQVAAFIGINDNDSGPVDKLLGALIDNADVEAVDDARTAVATGPDENSSVSLWTYTAGKKPLQVVVISGRMPETSDEVLLAPQSMTTLHTRIGERVTLKGSKGPATLKVTGSGLVPVGPHNGYAEGGWISGAGFDRLFKGFKYHLELVTLRPGARTPGAGEKLAAALIKDHPEFQGLTLDKPDPLTELAELRQVRVLPIVLGLFLALLAVGAVGHALATAVRRRSHDIAVLRALGMTQSQCRWVVVTQASVLAVIGLLFGVPLGLAIGRTVWRVVADYTPVQYVPPMAVWALLLVGPAALLIANLLAAWPGHRAARLRIAHILRTE
ncbi:MAG: putative transport system permease protein [Pseudonocardiales bacterium]|nr:putative transport system permease protein [Pseudonocardiales bacterium]